MPGEEILATLLSDPVFGKEHRFCITNLRIIEIGQKGAFSWEYTPYPLIRMKELNFIIDEGIFKSTIIMSHNGENPVRIEGVNKKDAREFLSVLEYTSSQNLELLSQQTKTCPDCAEQIKLLAKKCKYCGYRF